MNKEIFTLNGVRAEATHKNTKYTDVIACIEQLTIREWRRVFMEPSRLAGMAAQPLLFLLVFGIGFHTSFSWNGSVISYADFFFPGILGLVVLFSSIYATLTMVDDKKCGLFRLVLIGPAGVWGAVIGKICATFSLGFVQSLVFLPIGAVLGLHMSPTALLKTLVFLALGSWLFSVIGACLAWLSPSPSAFHALMSIILIPMWLLSGAMFPLDGSLFESIGLINPMAYLVDGLRMSLLALDGSLENCLIGLLIFSGLSFLLLVLAVKRRPVE